MTPEEAIELNKESEKSLRSHKFIEYADGVKLGIEALKLLIHLRSFGAIYKDNLLPNEKKNSAR